MILKLGQLLSIAIITLAVGFFFANKAGVVYGDDGLHVTEGGNVGIGTTSPAAQLDVGGTGAIKIPVGTTAQRPASPIIGMMRFNTTLSQFEIYSGNVWFSVAKFIFATGGTITEVGGYRIHTFTGSGTFTVNWTGNVEYLVVAGGGGSGRSSDVYYGGGGGAGGFRTGTLSVTPQAYTVTVGAGGAKGSTGNDGSNSVFGTITATGGGGGSYNDGNGRAGGSGGGAGGNDAVNTGGAGNSGIYSPVEGYAGGNTSGGSSLGGGGGGGSAGVGGNNSGLNGGTGGTGTQSSISGSAVYYAAGGGGKRGWGGSGSDGANGTGWSSAANRGHGGGPNGDGSSGIVIIRYLY